MAFGHALSPRGLCLPLAVVLGAAGCFGGDDAHKKDVDPGRHRITVWSLEFQPDRLRATRANVAAFTRKTHIGVDLVAIGDDELPSQMADARSTHHLPDARSAAVTPRSWLATAGWSDRLVVRASRRTPGDLIAAGSGPAGGSGESPSSQPC